MGQAYAVVLFHKIFNEIQPHSLKIVCFFPLKPKFSPIWQPKFVCNEQV
jgi:hypothetical protein